MKALKFILAGTAFGIVLVKSEAISWFRIQEMFRFHSFHMYGIIGTAVGCGIIGMQIIRKLRVKNIHGEVISPAPKEPAKLRYLAGGLVFGLGWALSGACPGPMAINIGFGFYTMTIVLISAVAGTYFFGVLRDKLPQ